MTTTPDGPRIHDHAVVDSDTIGRSSTVSAFAHVLEGARIGENCSIGSHAYIDGRTVIGDEVEIGPGVRICGAASIGSRVTIAANAVLHAVEHPITVNDGAGIGPGSCVAAGITIGRSASVAGGSIIDHDVPAHAIVAGNPARITGYIETQATPPGRSPSHSKEPSKVRGVDWIELPVISDMHGRLAVAELGAGLPFEPKRYFVVHDVPSRDARGEHAHRELHQVLTCVRGECSIVVDDGAHREHHVLNSPGVALHIQPMVWAAQFGFSEDAALLVLASEPYDPDDYIRDYDEFLAEVEQTT